MKIAFWGSSLVSAYWNGAATYYRRRLRALAQLGNEITFFEPDAYDRQSIVISKTPNGPGLWSTTREIETR